MKISPAVAEAVLNLIQATRETPEPVVLEAAVQQVIEQFKKCGLDLENW